jgi:hypothetical protein
MHAFCISGVDFYGDDDGAINDSDDDNNNINKYDYIVAFRPVAK